MAPSSIPAGTGGRRVFSGIGLDPRHALDRLIFAHQVRLMLRGLQMPHVGSSRTPLHSNSQKPALRKHRRQISEASRHRNHQ